MRTIFDNVTAASVTVPTALSALLRADASGTIATTTLQSNFSLTAGTLSLATALTSIDSITASAATSLTLTGGSSGASMVAGQGTGGVLTLTSPATGANAVDIRNSAAAGYSTFRFLDSAGTAKGYMGYANASASAFTATFYISAEGAAPVVFGNGSTEGMRLTATNRNLLIGGTTDISGSGGLKVYGTTASTNTTSGALQVVGGVGIAGALSIGATLNFDTGASTGTRVIQLGSTFGSGLWNIQNGATVIGSISASAFTSNVGWRSAVGGGPTAVDFGWASSSGFYSPTANTISIANNNIRVAAFAGGTLSTGGLTIDYTTASAGTTSGALIVGGGAGIAGRVSGGGGFYVSDSNSFTRNGGDGSTYINAPSGTTVALQLNGTSKLTVGSSETTLATSLVIPPSTPASAGAAGTAGTVTWDSSYVYVCTASNAWKRAAISTW